MIILSLNNLIINSTNKTLTHDKWNELVNFNISIDQLLLNIIGPTYKGIYNPTTEYNKYDVLWIDNKLSIVEDTISKNIASFQLNEEYKNAIYSNNALYYINKLGCIKKIINNAYTIFDSITVDEFKININGEIIARKGDRFYKIINDVIYPLNITFGSEIIDYTIDKNYIYFISENIIRYGNIYNNENTYFEEIEININPIVVSTSDNYLIIIDDLSEVYIINKSNFEFKKYIISNLNVNNIGFEIIPINDTYFGIYDGISSINYYKINSNSISFIVNKNIDEYSKILTNSNSSLLSISKNNLVNVINNIPFSFREVDINKILSNNGSVEINNYDVSIDFSKGQTFYNNFTPSTNSGTLIENKYIQLNSNKKIVFENLPSFFNKTLILEAYLDNTYNSTHIGYFKNNGKQIFFNNEKEVGHIKIIINTYNDYSDIFIFKDNKFMKYVNKVNSNTNNINEFIITGNGVNLKKIIILNSNSSKDDVDLYGKNNILTKDFSFNILKPYSYVKTNENGQAIIQTGTSLIKGILNISDNSSSNNSYTALSTKGANIIENKIKNIEDIIDDSFSLVGHTHLFSEIKNIPSATNTQKGIVYLSNSIIDDSSKAANVADLKRVYDLANHKHPYLNIEIGGTVKGNTLFTQLNANNFNYTNAFGNEFSSKNINVSNNAVINNLTVSMSSFKENATFLKSINVYNKINSNSLESSTINVTNTLTSKNSTIQNLSSSNSNITSLTTDNISNTNKIKTNNLESTTATIVNLNSNTANIQKLIINGYTLTIE